MPPESESESTAGTAPPKAKRSRAKAHALEVAKQAGVNTKQLKSNILTVFNGKSVTINDLETVSSTF